MENAVYILGFYADNPSAGHDILLQGPSLGSRLATFSRCLSIALQMLFRAEWMGQGLTKNPQPQLQRLMTARYQQSTPRCSHVLTRT